MYLRNPERISRVRSISNHEHPEIVSYIIFSLVLFLAFLFSSVTFSKPAPMVLIDSLNSPGTVYFDFGKSDLKYECFGLLDRLAETLIKDNSIIIEITGHTDNIGSEEFNNSLSVQRAESVKLYLLKKGVKEEQISLKGEGYNKPAAENTDEKHRAMNRRVEFVIISQNATEKITGKEIDESFANTSSWKTSGNEITGQLSVRDTAGEPVTDISENDVSAVLKWETSGKVDSAGGSVKLFPIDDKKKIAFTFIMDYSGSMFDDSISRFPKKSEEIIQMEKAVLTFIENMNADFYGRIIKFGVEIRELVRYTKSKNTLRDAVVNYTENLNGTALYRSIWFGLNDTMFNSNPTVMKTVIAFTDGEENSSGMIRKADIYKQSDKSGVRVYTVGLLEESKHSIPAGMKMTGEADLVEIAKNTGGFYYWARDPLVLPAIYQQIYNQIMKSYNISIMWHGDNLPPKGTPVTAVVRINIKGVYRTIHKNYIME